MNYWQLETKTTSHDSALIEEIAFGLDALSVDYSDSLNNPIFEPPFATTPLWNKVTLKILFSENIDKKLIENKLNTKGLTWKFIGDKIWENECKKYFKTIKFGKNLWICPTWEDDKDLKGVVISMNPGLAFGSGSHQTTNLCLTYLSNNPPINKVVIDYGTGTGVLAIAAKKLGAKKVIAIDNDPQAITATINNAKQNSTQLTALHTDYENNLEKVDILIANILANPLVELSKHFANLIKTKGTIVLSGILIEQQQMIIDAYSSEFESFKINKKDEWLIITGIKI